MRNDQPPPSIIATFKPQRPRNNTTMSPEQEAPPPVPRREDENEDQQPQEDPFDCFGSDFEESDEENDEQDERIITATNERSRLLIEKSNTRSITHNGPCVHLSSPNYEVFDSVGAGKGLKAVKNFARGEEILRERPAMRIPNQQAASSLEEAEERHQSAVHTVFQNLDLATQQAFMELSNCREDDKKNTMDASTIVGIYQTNSFRLADNEPYGGLFLTIARMNHSCSPNCNHIWRQDLKEMLVLATRDISAGEELCTIYGPSQYLDTSGRQSYLLERFSFTCGCEMCLEKNQSGGDDRMVRLDSLQEDISMFAASSNKPEAALEAIEESLELLKDQRIATGAMVKPLFHQGYQVAMGGLGDMSLAHAYISKELIAVNQSEGVGSPKAIEIQRILDGLLVDLKSERPGT
jgi:hypothetical protein